MFSSITSRVAARQIIAAAATTTSLPAVTARTTSIATRSFAGFPAPRLFDYETVTANLTVKDAVDSVEEAFSALAKGKVDDDSIGDDGYSKVPGFNFRFPCRN